MDNPSGLFTRTDKRADCFTFVALSSLKENKWRQIEVDCLVTTRVPSTGHFTNHLLTYLFTYSDPNVRPRPRGMTLVERLWQSVPVPPPSIYCIHFTVIQTKHRRSTPYKPRKEDKKKEVIKDSPDPSFKNDVRLEYLFYSFILFWRLNTGLTLSVNPFFWTL